MVKRLNSCEGIVAVERLKREREAGLEVRFSWWGRSEEVEKEGSGCKWLIVLEVMVTDGGMLAMTGLFRTS